MRSKHSSLRYLLCLLALLGISLTAQALPIESRTVYFSDSTPAADSSPPGSFSFEFAGNGAEFTGLDCATCAVTSINWQTPGLLWDSPAEVTLFDAVFSTLGELLSFQLNLERDETQLVAYPDGNSYREGRIQRASISWDGTLGVTGASGSQFSGANCVFDLTNNTTTCRERRPVGLLGARRTFDRVVVTPEPSVPALLGLGLLAAAGARRRRR
ncbi:MAG: PEP-CTERM sorting domain-containing protein [Gammaproteobacteria bacterium]|jgi:hypothetical protein|nr:PEP-CTERM sorting domain-containing protein [Gammaproteobacteria bacterium]